MSLILKPIFGILVNGIVLYVLTMMVPEILYTGGIKFFLIGALVLGIVNAFIKPVVKIFSLPFVLITGGMFLIVINMGILWFLSYFIEVAQFQDVTLAFPNFGTYVIGAIVLGLINWVTNLIT